MKLIAANWKCNPSTLAKAKELFGKVAENIKDNESAEVVICPPLLYIPEIKQFGSTAIKIGAQNCYHECGPYTGEISAGALKDAGCEYVIVGHSERRKLFGETDALSNQKAKAALAAGLKVIFCIGETAKERKDGKTEEVLENQIKLGLSGIENSENLVVAYEPIWAIGTGNACGSEDAKKSAIFLKGILGETAILYGGSVNSKNFPCYLDEAWFNGLLVGGASLKADEFTKIVNGIK